MNTDTEKKAIFQYEFDKKIEIEYCNLVYFNYMNKQDAFKKAEHTVQQEYIINYKMV